MAVTPGSFREAAPVAGLEIRSAGPSDLPTVAGIDARCFDSDAVLGSAWLRPPLEHPVAEVALVSLHGEPAGTAYEVRSDCRAGPAVYLAGVCVLPESRGRGIAAAVSSWLLARAFDGGAALGHLHPDDDAAARVYSRLGFREVAGFDVYVDLA